MRWSRDQRTVTERERGFAACAGEVSNGGGGSGALFNSGRRRPSDIWRSGDGLSVRAGEGACAKGPSQEPRNPRYAADNAVQFEVGRTKSLQEERSAANAVSTCASIGAKVQHA